MVVNNSPPYPRTCALSPGAALGLASPGHIRERGNRCPGDAVPPGDPAPPAVCLLLGAVSGGPRGCGHVTLPSGCRPPAASGT